MYSWKLQEMNWLSGNKQVITLLAAISLLGLFMSGCVKIPLTLEITSPEDGAPLETNLVRITGTVSSAEALVIINGDMARVDENGAFFAFVELAEGNNSIDVAASLGNRQVSQSISLAFTPPLIIHMDGPKTEAGVNYLETPVLVTGTVNYSEAVVTVNDITATVAEDGSFQAQVQLEEAAVIGKPIRAEATLDDGRSDTDNIGYFLYSDGSLIATLPGQGITRRLITQLTFDHSIELEAGETGFVDILLETRKCMRLSAEVSFLTFMTDREYGENEVSLPEGLNVYIEPSLFTAYPNAVYDFVIIVETTSAVEPGQYWFKLEADLACSLTGGWFIVIVEP
jgi:hypothetical protein